MLQRTSLPGTRSNPPVSVLAGKDLRKAVLFWPSVVETQFGDRRRPAPEATSGEQPWEEVQEEAEKEREAQEASRCHLAARQASPAEGRRP